VPTQYSATHKSFYYRLCLIIAGLVALVFAAVSAPPVETDWWIFAALFLFFFFQALFPFSLIVGEYTILHMTALGAGLLYGPAVAGWLVVLGSLAGYGVRRYLNQDPLKSRLTPSRSLLESCWSAAAILLAMVLGFYLAGWLKGWSGPQFTSALPVEMVLAAIYYTAIHIFGILGDIATRLPASFSSHQRDFTWLALLELLPLPFILITIQAYPTVGTATLLLLGGVPSLLAVLFSGISRANASLQRSLEELTTINQVSQALRTTIRMDELLPAIQKQVSKFLGVQNFYVAVYDEQADRLWYPLAVKNGIRQNWQPRHLEDRLTDRVIRERLPILIPSNASEELARIGLPVGEDAPMAWMGVPLMSSDKVIGCLAVFSQSPDIEFTAADLDLITILSGQVNVAIANTLLYEQVQQRARHLETLNQFSSLTVACLDPGEVLAQACRSVTKLGGGTRSAAYLYDLGQGSILLAQSYQLSDEFVDHNRSFSFTKARRTQCLDSGMPFLVVDASQADLDAAFLSMLAREGIGAFGDFPLTSPDGQIGYLSIYYDELHDFAPEEVELLRTLAAQAAMAVSNARLHARTDLALSRRLHQLSILETIGRELSGEIQSERLFEMILDYAIEFTDAVWGSLCLIEQATQRALVKAWRGYPERPDIFFVGEGLNQQAIQCQEVVYLPAVSQEPEYIDHTRGKAQSHLSVPLVHESQVLGVLSLESDHTDAFTAGDIGFVNQLANQAAVAVVNAALYADVTRVRDRLAAVLDTVGEGILLVEARGRIVLANKALHRITGLQPEKFLDHCFSELPQGVLAMFGYTPAQASQLIAALGASAVFSPAKVTITRQGLSPEIFVERIITPVFEGAGQSRGWMIVLRDVTEEQQIAQARELITETLVHDLRSPISAVLGALEVMEDALPSRAGDETDITGQALNVARRGAHRVLALIETLMDIARLQSGKMDILPARTELKPLVSNMLNEFIAQANEYGVILRNDVPEDIPHLNVDQGKITRVLANLVDNALKFSPSGGQIAIAARPMPGQKVLIQVSDNGPGIPEDYREKVFERFSQVPGLRGRRRGTGLGLTFCRLAVEAHQGNIWVESNPAGGSLINLTLPCVDEEPYS